MSRRARLHVDSLEARGLLSALSVTLTTDALSYQLGEPVRLTFIETNNSNQPITVDEGPSTNGFEVDQGQATIWRSNAGINPLFIEADTIQPGQSLTLTATWNGLPNLGNSTSTPPTGDFVVMNQLNPNVRATFAIKDLSVKSTRASNVDSPASVPTMTSPVVGVLSVSGLTSKPRHETLSHANHGMLKRPHVSRSPAKFGLRAASNGLT